MTLGLSDRLSSVPEPANQNSQNGHTTSCTGAWGFVIGLALYLSQPIGTPRTVILGLPVAPELRAL